MTDCRIGELDEALEKQKKFVTILPATWVIMIKLNDQLCKSFDQSRVLYRSLIDFARVCFETSLNIPHFF